MTKVRLSALGLLSAHSSSISVLERTVNIKLDGGRNGAGAGTVTGTRLLAELAPPKLVALTEYV